MEWLALSGRGGQAGAAAAARAAPPAPPPRAAPPPAAAAARRKLGHKEQRELDALPDRIDELEREQKALGELLAQPALYTETPQRVAEVQARYDSIDTELMDLLERWETLSRAASP